METILKFQRQFPKLSAERAVHIVMVIFAMASVTNIKSFFIATDHDPLTAWAIGMSLGLVLVSVSIMLTTIDYDNEKKTFYTSLGITIAVALMSGSIQMLAYYEHLQDYLKSSILGFGLPLVGECGLAVATAMYSAAHKRQKIRSVGSDTEERIASLISDALSDVDVTKVKKYVERQVDKIVRSQVDRIVENYLRANGALKSYEPNSEGDNDCSASPKMNGDVPVNHPTIDRANEQRQNIVDQRKQAILNILDAHGALGVTDVISHLPEELTAKRGAVTTNLNDLKEQGLVFNDKKKWRIGVPIIEAPDQIVDEQPGLHSNGAGKARLMS